MHEADRIGWCIRKLERAYGKKQLPAEEDRPAALDSLVLTILSQNTTDLNRDRAYHSLKTAFPDWESVKDGNLNKIRSSIKVGGLADRKSRRIKKILQDIHENQGRLDLNYVCRMPVNEAHEHLLSLDGVGEKTAAIVLLFACGKPVFPVDTHIFRVTGRLGLIPENTNIKKAHQKLNETIPNSKKYGFHINLIEHGRAVCKARKPNCPHCCLREKCQYYKNQWIPRST